MRQEEELREVCSEEVEAKAKASSSSPRGPGSSALIMQLSWKKHTPLRKYSPVSLLQHTKTLCTFLCVCVCVHAQGNLF